MLNTEFAAAVLEGIEGTLEELIGRVGPAISETGSPRSKMRRPPSDAHSKRRSARADGELAGLEGSR